ncbi:MAG: HAMP domain-containing sensor histidine kinase [bacterium]
MNIEISTLIQDCQWFPSQFLIFSGNVFSPLLYYTYLGSLIPALFIGLVVLFKDFKKLENRLFFMSIACFSLWILSALVTWATELPSHLMFFWAAINIFEPLIYFFAFYFIYVFLYKKDFSFLAKIFLVLPLLPVIFLTPTNFTILGFDLSTCDRAAINGVMVYYNYIIEILYTISIVVVSVLFIKKDIEISEKKKAILVLSGILAFLLSFSLGNILESVTDNWYIGQYGLLGAPIFVGFIAYMIVRFKAFNIKVIGTQVLVLALGFLVFIILFIRKIEDVRIVVIITLLFVFVLGYLLIKSVKKEIEQKEKLAKLNVELEQLIQQRESLVHLVTHKVKGSFTHSKYIFAGMIDGMFGPLSPELKKAADMGLESDNNGVATVDLILNAANLQKGTVKYDMKPTNFKELVEKTFEEKKEQAEKKGLKIEKEITGDDCIVNGDAFWLKEVVHNFIENSIRYTASGTVTVGLKKENNIITYYVKDTGVGVTDEDKKNLFTEGGRGKNSVKVNVDSTGYGLYTVKLVVEAHGGKVWVESPGQDKGSTFFVQLNAI